MQKAVALIVAGGIGTRMGADIPKQFLTIAGKSILQHTIEKFYTYNKDMPIYVVLPLLQQTYWKDLCKNNNFAIQHKVITGGDTRFQSVKNGLDAITINDGIVFIHDGVRPFVKTEVIDQCYNSTIINDCAIPAIDLIDSIRYFENIEESKSLDRNKLKAIQTPQTFKLDKIKKAYLQSELAFFTDDASVYENAGNKIYLVNGNIENIKITNKQDLHLAEYFLVK